jgi:hypothetical protein
MYYPDPFLAPVRPSSSRPLALSTSERIIAVDLLVDAEVASVELWRKEQMQKAYDWLIDDRRRFPNIPAETHCAQYLTTLTSIWGQIEILGEEIQARALRSLAVLVEDNWPPEEHKRILSSLFHQRRYSFVNPQDDVASGFW